MGILKKKNIKRRLINISDESFLNGKPHRKFLDMAIYYVMEVFGHIAIPITDEMAQKMGVSEDDMYTISSNDEFVYKILNQSEDYIDFSNITRQSLSSNEILLLKSARKDASGSTAITRTDVLKKLAEVYGKDLYLMPVSIYDVIVVPEGIHGINLYNPVKPEDKLTDNVYIYLRAKKTVELAKKI